MKFDDILKDIGEFGFYQKRLYLLLCIPAISVGCFMMMNIILLHTPDHRCKIPNLPNDTYEIQSEAHAELVNKTIPPSKDYDYDRCHIYVRPNDTDVLEEVKCSEWVYSQDVFTETFTSKENFVCGNALKTSHAQMIYYAGVLAGDLGFGLLSDVLGRRPAFEISAVLQLAAALGIAWAPNFWAYVILEFAVGAACHGVFMSSCVLGLEVVGPSKRVWAGVVIHAFFTVGLCYLSGVAWLLQNWFTIQLAVAIPCGLYLFYWWLIPESPRWLLSMGRKEEAEAIIERMAKANKVDMPKNPFGTDTISKQYGGKLWQLFTSKVLFIRTMIIFVNWIVVSMCYYGVTMYAGTIGGNFYLNFFLLALVEFPAFVCIPMLDRIGRKYTHVIFMWLGGFACIATIFTVVYGGDDLHTVTLILSLIGKLGPTGAFSTVYVYSLELYPTLLRNGGMGASSCVARFGGMAAPYVAKMVYVQIFLNSSVLLIDLHIVTLLLSLIGKLGPSGAFATVYVYSLELYPTLLRNGGMGASSCVARFGGMAAPYVAKMGELIGGDLGKGLPLAIFGVASIVAGALCLFLPETLNTKLPDTVEDAKHFKGYQRKKPGKEIYVDQDSKKSIENGIDDYIPDSEIPTKNGTEEFQLKETSTSNGKTSYESIHM